MYPLVRKESTIKPYYDSPEGQIYLGDALEEFPLPDESVHCCVTSPPYWGLRDYGIEGQLGLEKTPEEYIEKMVQIFREVRRVLRKDGTLWLNLGDSYWRNPARGNQENGGHAGLHTGRSAAGAMQHKGCHLPEKNLLGIPWRVALALQADGWWLRSDIIWHKPNPMPESVTDRPTKSHEYIFLLTKSAKYYYDAEAIRENKDHKGYRKGSNVEFRAGKEQLRQDKYEFSKDKEWFGRNKRSVWTIPTKPFSGAHFAVFPPALIEPCILAGTSEKGCCVECGGPWERIIDYKANYTKREKAHVPNNCQTKVDSSGWDHPSIKTTSWQPTCKCETPGTRDCALAGRGVYCTVLDPFFGSGTTGTMAYKHRRSFIGIELSQTYLDEIAIPRIKKETSQMRLFN